MAGAAGYRPMSTPILFDVPNGIPILCKRSALLWASRCFTEGYNQQKPQGQTLIEVVAQSCLTLCKPMDYSTPCSSVHGFSQARILEWVAISSSRDLPNPGIELRSPALEADSLLSEPPEQTLIDLNQSWKSWWSCQ